MAGAAPRAYRFAGVEVYPQQARLVRAGQETHLRQKSFQVLAYLIEHRDRLVPKGELLDRLWPETAVTEGVLGKCIIDIRQALGDDAQQPKFIKNVPRVGYRFIHPVEELALTGAPHLATRVVEESRPVDLEYSESSGNGTVLSMRRLAVTRVPWMSGKPAWLLGLAALAIATGVVYLGPRLRPIPEPSAVAPPPPVRGKQPVVVMFFENTSRNPELDWLREGLADMLITSLSRVEHLGILSRQQLHLSLQRTRGKRAAEFRLNDALQVARSSNVETVIAGSFAQLGEQIRIDARVHDAQTGVMTAAESLIVSQPDRLLEQVDLLASRLARHLGAPDSHPAAEQRLSSVMTNSLEAYRFYSLAVEMAEAYHSTEALELLKKAIALDPDFAMAYARIGYIHAVIHNNEGEAAKPYLEKAFQLSPRLTEKDRLWIVTWYALAHEDTERARRTLRQIVARYPLEVEAYSRLGALLSSITDSDEKISVFKQGLAIDPAAQDLWNQLGFAYCHLGRYEEAFAAFKRYIELAPAEANAYDSLGMCYNEAGRFDEALLEFKRALELNPRFHLTHIHVGDSFVHQGRFRKAEEQYRQALELAPTDWDRAFAYNKLAILYLKKGDLAQAEAAARQEPRLKNDLGGMFFVALARGDLAAAERLKDSLLAGSPEVRPLSGAARHRAYFLGRYALEAGRAEEALNHLREFAQSPQQIWNDRWPDCLAEALLELGRWDEAIAEYQRLIAHNPNYALLHYHLGRAYEGRGDVARALAAYEEFLKLWSLADPDIPEVQAARTAVSRPVRRNTTGE